jgi:dipeptidyl aminopeptidase/acylaminoacyl peptidase
MRTLRCLACLISAASLPVTMASSAAAQTPNMNKMPPLIDRVHFFGDPEISGAQISPDGQFIAFMRPYQGTKNIWVKRTAEPFDKARAVTADTKRPIPGFFWSRDGTFILYVQDQGGNENYNVHAVNPAEAPAPGGDVPKARNITDAKGVRAVIFSVPKSDPDAIYVGLNDRDQAWHDVYKVRISTGERTLVAKNTERMTGVVFDLKDQLRMVTRSAENGDTEFLRADEGGKFTKVYTCNVFETCQPLRFHKDGRRLYVITNKGAEVDLIRLALLDVQTGEEELVESDPERRVDLGGARFSEKTDELVLTAYVDDRTRLYWKDKAYEADYAHLKRELGDKELGFTSSTTDERIFLVSATSDVEPGEMYLFDRGSRQLTLQYRTREQLPREALAPMKGLRYKSSDGLEIPAYLTLPAGVAARNLPAVVVPHGGPWARDAWGYNSLAQYLANRGYAVLMPNFRGSTGYGKRFLDAGNRQWGDKMQDDITWGVKHLVTEGVADPKRVGILGGSYGGYAALAALTFTPEVYAAGVSIVGPSNLMTLLNSIPPYWEAGKKVFHERMGDPATPEGRKQLERQSPLNHAGKIKTPLLVIQGANDPRVNKNESDQIVVALRDRGFPVEYLVAPDEGHGFARPVNNLAAFAAAEKFLAKHLGGRNQEDMTPEVAARLKEITVDPKAVTVKMSTPAAADGTPKPAVALAAGTRNYNGRIEMAGQTVAMSISTDIKEEDDGWVVTETARAAPAGDAVDRTTLDKGTLALRRRTVTQGPMSIEMTVRDGKVTGEMKMSGQSRPFSVDLGGDLFADGGGAYHVAAALPLAEGYRAAYRNFDLRTRKVKVVQLQVVGSERVTVPAGAFDAFKAEITGDDGAKTTIWVAKDTHTLLKVQATSPAMAGATLTSELVK